MIKFIGTSKITKNYDNFTNTNKMAKKFTTSSSAQTKWQKIQGLKSFKSLLVPIKMRLSPTLTRVVSRSGNICHSFELFL